MKFGGDLECICRFHAIVLKDTKSRRERIVELYVSAREQCRGEERAGNLRKETKPTAEKGSEGQRMKGGEGGKWRGE